MSEPKVLLTDLGIPESPRWHEGRLWFCNWIDRQVVAVGLDGKPEVMLIRPKFRGLRVGISCLTRHASLPATILCSQENLGVSPGVPGCTRL